MAAKRRALIEHAGVYLAKDNGREPSRSNRMDDRINYLKLTRITGDTDTAHIYVNPDAINAMQEITHPWTGGVNRATQLYFAGQGAFTQVRNEGFYVRESINQILEQIRK